ncbi:ead/Ea22-like family protein [Kosakonia sp.]|uniref:ead/Ea22-like family protein n=1 Tax=Kosakonia sp. TaxID=1916651 RepID=UPI0028AB1096|nr:ead/Ea22-like family protein [Kosakonia sp.]
MTNNDELALKLKAAAEKATPGPWYVHDKPCEDGNYGIDSSDKEFLAEAVVWWGFSRQSIWREEDAKYIAASNPAAILALLAERDADKKRIAELEREKEAMTAVALAMRDDMRDARSLVEARTVSVKPAEQYEDDSALLFAIDLNDESEDYQTAQWLKELRRRRAAMQAEPVTAATVPDGYCVMPLKLTAANGAKGALSGEFHILRTVTCRECGGDGCEDCDDQGEWEEEIPIGWDIIKLIYAAAVEACALTETQAAPEQEV